MIAIPPLTPELLAELGREIGGCDFTGEDQRSFLSAATSCDVQAAPGNGKTTLLVAKLALLSRSWTSRAEGVCVISHTNAARLEVENKLSAHPRASAFLSYPHFIGTVTSFIDRFIALPYLRGLGWTVQHIDDDMHAAVALSRWRSKPALVRYAHNREYALKGFVSGLELAPDFAANQGIPPRRLKVRQKPQQPGSGTATGASLEELKADIVSAGYYRYADMVSLAYQAIEKCPLVIERLRKRFPLVLLDEAQDTNGPQLNLINRLFGEDVAYQRLGDQNQTLYEDPSLDAADYWRAGAHVIPLNDTRRLGADIAAFASRLTSRARQQIQPRVELRSRRALFFFDDFSIRDVLSMYAQEVRVHWGENLTPELDIRAVASRHNPAAPGGDWPKTLIDYCPTYRNATRVQGGSVMCALLRQAASLLETHAAPADIADVLNSAIVRLLRCQGLLSLDGSPVTKLNFMATLRGIDSSLALRVRRLMRDHILVGNAAWSGNAWVAFREQLIAAVTGATVVTREAADFLQFVPYNEEAEPLLHEQGSRTVFDHEGVSIRLGSIHSVKGLTVDAILAMETEVYRGNARADRAMDLATVLPHAFGIEDRDFTANRAQLAAATNIFVAATRARQVLCLAMRRSAASDALIDAAAEQGWVIRDLTANRAR
jgi:DNA helicase II / ATP-dependent DNA helicase PcrA